MADEQIEIRGLTELEAGLDRRAATLRRDFDLVVADSAAVVARRAREIAAGKGLVRSGDMVSSIKPVPGDDSAAVIVPSRHRGYPYPRRLEYEARVKGVAGSAPRAFLHPALQQETPGIDARMKGVLDMIAGDLAR